MDIIGIFYVNILLWKKLEKGMSVEVVTSSMSNPLTTNGGQAVADAFMRVYGIDAKKAGILSTVYLDVVKIG